MTVQEISKLKDYDLIDYVDTLSDIERLELRNELKSIGSKKYLLRGLWYNYATQSYIFPCPK